MRRPHRQIALSCLLLTLFLTGCGSKPATVNYYSLQAGTLQFDTQAVLSEQITVGIGPVRLPQLLKRPHLVTRDDSYQVRHAETERWSGDLQEEVTYVLADSLTRQLGSEKIALYPWPNRLAPDWQLRVDVQRLDGVLGKSAYLEARWVLTDNREDLVLSGLSRYQEEINAPGYQGLVAAESRLLETFAQEMAEKIRSRH